MDLSMTVREPLYRGDSLNRKVIYLCPQKIGEIDLASAQLYLSYIRADGTPDIVLLERMSELYNAEYYQFTFPVTCKLTQYAGEVCTWITIFDGPPSAPQTAKSSECVLRIQQSKNLDDCLCDCQITALYQMQKQMTQSLDQKADGLDYDEATRKLQLKSGESAIGESVTIPSDQYRKGLLDEIAEEWSDMNSTADADSADEWESM